MVDKIVIINDIERSADYIRNFRPDMVQAFTDAVFDMVDQQRIAGWDIAYLGSVFTNDGSQFQLENPTPPSEEQMHFVLLKLDKDGKANNIAGGFVIDLTDGSISDIVITSVH
jgi:hypothetical protein